MADTKKSRHWAQEKERGTVFGILFMMYSFKLLGARICKLFMVPVVFYYYLFNATARRNLYQYMLKLNKYYDDVPIASQYNVLKIFLNFGFGIVDRMQVWQGSFNKLKLRKHHSHIFLDLIAAKKGAVIMVSHLGNFEISRMFSSKHRGAVFNIFMHTKNAKKITQVIKKMNPNYTLSIIQGDELNIQTAMLLKEKVDAGEFVVIAGDRIPVNNEQAVIQANLLGEPADFPVGPYVLAKVLSCPMIGMCCTQSEKTYHLEFVQLAEAIKFNRKNRQQVLAEYAQKYAASIEEQLKVAPLQWYNFHDFWQPSISKGSESK